MSVITLSRPEMENLLVDLQLADIGLTRRDAFIESVLRFGFKKPSERTDAELVREVNALSSGLKTYVLVAPGSTSTFTGKPRSSGVIKYCVRRSGVYLRGFDLLPNGGESSLWAGREAAVVFFQEAGARGIAEYFNSHPHRRDGTEQAVVVCFEEVEAVI